MSRTAGKPPGRATARAVGTGTVLAALGCSPLLWLYGGAVLALSAAVDLLAWPLVAARRRQPRPADAPPAHLDASIVVLSYNGAHYLEQLLPTLETAVARTPGDHEIVVVDNGSDDGTAELVAARHPGVRLVRLPENRYFIRGNRAGVEAATRDVLVFVNNDMQVEPDFLRQLLQGFGPPDVFAVTARIEMDGVRVETGRTRAELRRGALHFVQTDGPPAPAIPALWAGGGSSAFDRAKYLALGGFEDLYEPCYAEDVSLSYRAWRRGWRVVLQPHSGVRHVHRGTSERVFSRRQVERIDRRNRELLLLRAVTDLRLSASHALWLPWNALKDSRRTGLGVQLLALASTLPRLPSALAARQRLRAAAVRGDRDTLRVACSVREHRRELGVEHTAPVVLSLGQRPAHALPELETDVHTVPVEVHDRPTALDRLGLVPRRYWGIAGDGALADLLRDLIREHDHDVLLVRDRETLAAIPAHLALAPLVLAEDGDEPPRGWRAKRYHRRLLRRAAAVAVDLPPDQVAATCRALATADRPPRPH